MFNVNDKVHVSKPNARRDIWKNVDGVVLRILEAHNPFTNKDEKIHIIRLADGTQSPIEEQYLTLL